MVSLFPSKPSRLPPLASEDIGYLVECFPPAPPSGNSRALVRSLSGKHLVKSEKVQQEFERLLEESRKRIDLVDLAKLTGVSEAQWLLNRDQSRRQLYYSRDRRAILPTYEAQHLLETLWQRSNSAFVYLDEFADDHDILPNSLEALCHASSHTWHSDIGDQGRAMVCSESRLLAVTNVVEAAISGSVSSAKHCDLNDLIPDVPVRIMKIMATEAIGDSQAGVLELSQGQLVFMPASALASQQADMEKEREELLESHLRKLEEQGFCVLDALDHATAGSNAAAPQKEIIARYTALHADDGLTSVPLASAPDPDLNPEAILVKVSLLQTIESAMTTQAQLLAPEAWHSRTNNAHEIRFTAAIADKIVAASELRELAALLMRTSTAQKVEMVFVTHVNALMEQVQVQFQQCLNERLCGPLYLYAHGIESIVDETLKRNVAEFVTDYFRREFVLETVELLKKERLIVDKGTERDVDRLASAVTDAKTLSDLQAAVSKFARKQKLRFPPNDQTLGQVKHSVRESKVKAMHKMTRPSDLLQNLTWILLAEKYEGLFVSAGKDTTRMIKQYGVVGNKDVAGKLEGFRDVVKKGEVGGGVIADMRAMAAESAQRAEGLDVRS